MEHIAAKAKINKAMLYYYYSSKDNLFHEVLKTITQEIFQRVFAKASLAIANNESPVDKVKLIVSAHFDAFSQDINLTKILLHTLANEPNELRSAISALKGNVGGIGRGPIEIFVSIFEEGVLRKELRDIDPKQVLISMVGMNLVYFIGKPVAEAFLNLIVEDDQAFLKERKESIIDLVLHGIVQK
jgi:TetR/AcrR family transcriptional regulator